MVFWLVSLPSVNGRKDKTWELLQEKTSSGQQLSSNFKLDLPDLRVGTLDTLMTLSDDLQKISMSVEGVVGKIRRTVQDVGGPTAVAGLRVESRPVEDYITHFRWDEAKYPSRRPLKDTVEKVTEIIGRIEDDLKVKTSEYNNLKSQMSAASRKSSGSLAVRDLKSLVKPEHMVNSENLTTLFVVVSKYGLKEWGQTYEKLSDFVVPRSSKVVAEDNDYALVSIVLFRRVLDDFKAAARTKGYQVREYVANEGQEDSQESIEGLRSATEQKRATLEAWTKTAFGEAFSAWMHVFAVRLFVESILRYGLPPYGQPQHFQAAVLKPTDKLETRLRNTLAAAFADGSGHWKDDGATAVPGLVADTDLFPYVSFTLKLD